MIYALSSDGETPKRRENKLPIRFDGVIYEIKRRLITKNGKSVGISVYRQRYTPSRAEESASEGRNIKNVQKTHTNANIVRDENFFK